MQAALCEHIKTDGKKCEAVALRDQKYCYYHDRYKHDNLPSGMGNYDAPVFEDSRSILLGVHQTMTAMLSGRLDPKLAGLALYGYQVASSVVNRQDARSPIEEQQLKAEARAFEELKLKSKAKATKESTEKKEEKKDGEEEGPSLVQILIDTILDMRRSQGLPDPDFLDEESEAETAPSPSGPDEKK